MHDPWCRLLLALIHEPPDTPRQLNPEEQYIYIKTVPSTKAKNRKSRFIFPWRILQGLKKRSWKKLIKIKNFLCEDNELLGKKRVCSHSNIKCKRNHTLYTCRQFLPESLTRFQITAMIIWYSWLHLRFRMSSLLVSGGW